MRKAIYGLSGDPITNGHIWVIEEAAELFDELLVVIADSPNKSYTFPLEERLKMAKAIIARIASETGKTITVGTIGNSYLAIFAQNNGIKYLVRGIRNEKDFTYEREMWHINREIAHETKTIFLIPPKNLDGVSSSFVKAMIGPDGWEEFVRYSLPLESYRAVVNKFSKRKDPEELTHVCGMSGFGRGRDGADDVCHACEARAAKWEADKILDRGF